MKSPSISNNSLSGDIKFAKEVNEKLLQRYLQILNRDVLLNLVGNEQQGELSGIFVPEVSQNYLNSPCKVMLVGKETKGWCGSLSAVKDHAELRDYLSKNMSRHGETSKMKPGHITFLQFYQSLPKKLNPFVAQSNDAVLWANLFCLSLDKASPNSADNSELISELSLKLLEAQIDVLAPKIIFFVSGPSYDKYIKLLCSKYEGHKTDTDVFVEREIWKFKTSKFTGYRTKHPAYPASNKHRDTAIELIRSDLDTSEAINL